MIIPLLGPIKAWWGPPRENTVEHKAYIAWRDYLSTQLIQDGHLVYHPYRAFGGAWDERAQIVNDVIIQTCDMALVLTPEGVPSDGTDGELRLLKTLPQGRYLHTPPPAPGENFVDEMKRKYLYEILPIVGVNKDGRVAMDLPLDEWNEKAQGVQTPGNVVR